jgi:hypothetical protein
MPDFQLWLGDDGAGARYTASDHVVVRHDNSSFDQTDCMQAFNP